ncbi:MAG: rod shape-determining protein MreC [Candidatus Aminicenantes bacterium]|nr:rod shape-determining protein MreC [Candidatus Aminicenantes bacterium]
MSFLRDRKNISILLVLIVFNLILISLQVYLEEAENFIEKVSFSIFAAVKHGFSSLMKGISRFWENYFDLWHAKKKNREMNKEITRLRHENILLKNSLKEFRDIEEIKKDLIQFHNHILLARIISLDFSNLYKSAIIDKGTMDGIEKNMAVCDKYGHLLGRVIEPISLKEARIQLITDNLCAVGIYTENSMVYGILKGKGNGMCFLDHILTTEKSISLGETVTTSGYDGIYPQGIRVGSIISMEESSSLFQKVEVRPYFNFNRLDMVVVLKKNDQ